MRADEFINSDEKLDEILPLIGMAAGAAARSVAGMAAKQVGKAVAGAAAQKIGQKVAGMAGSQKQPTLPGDNTAYADVDRAKDALLQPGKKLVLPTQAGTPQAFKITKVAGDEVEIENPDAIKDPSQPDKITYNKQDIKKSISI
jgi:hypothetical protein